MTRFDALCANEPEFAKLRMSIREFLHADRAEFGWQPTVDSWLGKWDEGFSARLGDAGFLGLTIPESYGGHGLGHLHRYVVVEELLAQGAPVAAHWVADRQVAPGLLAYGSDEQRLRLLAGGVFNTAADDDELRLLVDDIGRRSFDERLGNCHAPERFDDALWRTLEETGLARLTSSADLGAGPGELAVVLCGVAHHAGSVPIAETDLLAAWLGALAGLELPDGPLTVAIADADVSGGQMTGTAVYVPWTRAAAAVLAARSSDVLYTESLDLNDIVIDDGHNLAGEPRDRISFDLPAAALNARLVGRRRAAAPPARSASPRSTHYGLPHCMACHTARPQPDRRVRHHRPPCPPARTSRTWRWPDRHRAVGCAYRQQPQRFDGTRYDMEEKL
jgi:Acyl-CoA dehydrogenase, N-terminal domain